MLLSKTPQCVSGVLHLLVRSRKYTTGDVKSKAKSRHVIITGATRGIGLATAKAFIKAGDKLCIVSRNRVSLTALVDEWNDAWRAETGDAPTSRESAEPPRHTFFTGDVSQAQLWKDLVSHLRTIASDGSTGWCGPPDVLVNCAGISQSSRLESTEPVTIERIVQTNLMGAIWGCKYVGKVMMDERRRVRIRKRREGSVGGQSKIETRSPCIVNVSSLLALKGGIGTSIYTASKAGVLGLTRSLAAEMGPLGVRMNAVVPGYIETSMIEDFSHEYRRELEKKIPLERFGMPGEVAAAVMFLVENEYANNCVINLDGGLSAT